MAYVYEVLAEDCEHAFISFYDMHRCYISKPQTVWNNWVILEYPNKHSKLHQGLGDIVYLRSSIDFDCISVVLKVYI